MNESTLIGLLCFLAVAIPVVQHFRFKKLYAGYKTIQEAIQNESSRLTSMRSEFVTAEGLSRKNNELAENEVARAEAAVERTNKAQSTLGELELSTQRARSELTVASTELATVKANLEANQRLHNGLAATVSQLTQEKTSLEARIMHLLALEQREQTLHADLEALSSKLQREQGQYEITQQHLNTQLDEIEIKIGRAQEELANILGRVDLYSRVDEYTRVGHFEMPDYLYDTSVRYQSEIKEVRESQRKLIREKGAITYPEDLMVCADKSLNKKILDGQMQLMLSAFNIECDLLIEKVSPANLDRTLEQIEKKAEALEKSCATLKCGFNIAYVDLKFEECKLQFEYVLKKKEEQEEQRLIREQMREEIRVQKQYEDAIKEAEKDELKFSRLLEKAREHLAQESELERSLSLAKIHLLEEQLKEAQERSIRAKSMAEQTRRGFVYVISNIGAFGEGVYKIGLTRRLEPQERVDELGDASVPFPFDVHAMCYSDDAPALEYALHKRFGNLRVNAVNLRKEFFRVSLEEIQTAIEEIVDDDVEFMITAKADDYFKSKRLMAGEC